MKASEGEGEVRREREREKSVTLDEPLVEFKKPECFTSFSKINLLQKNFSAHIFNKIVYNQNKYKMID